MVGYLIEIVITLDKELKPANIFDCPAILAVLQKIGVLFSSINLYVDNIEEIARTVIWTHGHVASPGKDPKTGPYRDQNSRASEPLNSLYSADREVTSVFFTPSSGFKVHRTRGGKDH
ncbi:hypothetical protein TNCV_4246791 [Trichonephila clavipes]|nr:hypothetical protein TNCV_4246791 [Trichonephila clavipes]